MKNTCSMALILICLLFINCKKESKINGTWLVKSVTVGDNEMTPNARWMKFNKDFTQQSGNGWFQHSIGTYTLNSNNNDLTIINSNGLKDLSEPFRIRINDSIMTWKRNEDNQPIEVKLVKIEKLPTTYGDKLLGLWKLENSEGNGSFFNDSNDSNSYIFFRWDKRFQIGNKDGKINGVYNVHGHKPEVELIPYNNQMNRSFWKINFNGDSIILKLLNSDNQIIKRTFKRVNEFPK